MKKDKKGFFGEFKEFIMRGNVIDMAIGVVIATAFGAITKALVDKIIMPLVGLLIGGIDLAKWDIVLKPEVLDETGVVATEAVVLGIGSFLVTIIDFIIIAFVIFLIVKAMNKAKEMAEAKKKEEEPEPEEDSKPTTEELLAEILEEIKNKK
ncbi:MAG: large conductance mechanosensitive channel protein MscL [Clostridia bacterium]|nr:large conductance mechanosensitive channel protein MscL [Clostridia bacterium]